MRIVDVAVGTSTSNLDCSLGLESSDNARTRPCLQAVDLDAGIVILGEV